MKLKIIQITKIVLLLLFGSIQPIIPVWANQKIPNTKLSVTVQQKVSGELDPALHIQKLFRFNGECSLTSITLNSCRSSPVSNGMASPVIVER